MGNGFPGEDDYNPNMDLTTEANGDDNLVLNLEDASDEMPEFQPMPPGIYEAIVENVEYGTSKSSGNPMLSWVFTITDPEWVNRKLFYHTVLNSESGQTRLKQAIVRIGVDVNMKEFNPRKFADEGLAVGLPLRVKINIRPYKGKRQNNVTEVLEPSQGGYMDEVI